MSKKECYVSTDVETNGPIPGVNSMIQLGSVAYDANGNEIGEFVANLDDLPGSVKHPQTTIFYEQNVKPEVMEALMKNREDPEIVMKRYVAWLKGLPDRPIFVGYPAGFDFTHVFWYLHKFTGESPFSFSCLDIKSMCFALGMQPTFSNCIKSKMPKEWTEGLPKHTHNALDDAREQGVLFFRILKECRNSPNSSTSPEKRTERLERRMDMMVDGFAALTKTLRKG